MTDLGYHDLTVKMSEQVKYLKRRSKDYEDQAKIAPNRTLKAAMKRRAEKYRIAAEVVQEIENEKLETKYIQHDQQIMDQ